MTALTETTSLLPPRDTENQPANIHEAATRSLSKDADIFTRAGKLTILLAGISTVMFQFADILRFAPSMRLFELGYCRQYYPKHNQGFIDAGGNVSEHLCKIGEVQEQLSLLKAWLGTSEGAVGLLLVTPYGMLAEVKGGRFVAGLNLIGYALSSLLLLREQRLINLSSFCWIVFPINAIVVSPLLRAIGGGAPISSAVILATVANAAPTSERSTVFFLMGAAELVTEMIMPLISAAFMSKGFIYSLVMLGFVFEALALIAVYAIPLDTESQDQQSVLPDADDAPKKGLARLPHSGSFWITDTFCRIGSSLSRARAS
ncbi:hypothetical protein D6D20_09823 [Aureobasidium pullulans]|uniref:MFS general substrate transporter n=1 Tax=Aureobasidium pullulans TaxID=5580 RepID=A0A4S9YRM2_AURPU|nr:hypothetical protein D6D20_09823 [Aureobasidium pullulans]THZ94673.1 hypothetical protein D6C82_08154 [Aureobasidium pullulans]